MPAAASHWPASKIQPGIGPLVFQHDQGLSDGDAIVVVNPDFLDDAAFQCTLLWLSVGSREIILILEAVVCWNRGSSCTI